jgi:hypothetical protein
MARALTRRTRMGRCVVRARQNTGLWCRRVRASSVLRDGNQFDAEGRATGGWRRGLCFGQCHPKLTAALQSRVREDGDREARDTPVVLVLGNGPGPYMPVLPVLRADARTQDERAAGLSGGLQRIHDARSIVGMKCAQPIEIRGGLGR